MLAQLQLEDGEADAAREVMAAWSTHLEHNRTPASVQAWVVDALALDALAEHEERPNRWSGRSSWPSRTGASALLDFGRALQPLLTRQLRRGTAHRALVGELLAALDGSERRAPVPVAVRDRAAEPAGARGAALPADDDVQPGDRVRAVRLGEHGQDDLKAIYRKLDVADRREAVRRARSLELLAP